MTTSITSSLDLASSTQSLRLIGTETTSTLKIALDEPTVKTALIDITPQRPAGLAANMAWSWNQVIHNSDLNLGTLGGLQGRCNQTIRLKYLISGQEFPFILNLALDCGNSPQCPAGLSIHHDDIGSPCDTTTGQWHIRLHADIPESRVGHYEWIVDGVAQGEGDVFLTNVPASNGIRRLVLEKDVPAQAVPTTIAVTLKLSSDANECRYSTSVIIGPCEVSCPRDIHIIAIKVLDASNNDRASDS